VVLYLLVRARKVSGPVFVGYGQEDERPVFVG